MVNSPVTTARTGARGTTASPAPSLPPVRPAGSVRTATAYAGAHPAKTARTARRAHPVLDLRARAPRTPARLAFAPGDLVAVSGLPGSGKSTLMRRTVPGLRIDSQDTRDRFAARLPHALPYAFYRPAVRLAHFLRLRRALRTGTGLVVHDCGTQAWVRRWLAREAVRRGRGLHLVLLDVDPDAARAGQSSRGRRVSRYAFARHRRAVARLLHRAGAGQLPPGCTSAVLLDRTAADALRSVVFTARAGTPAGGTVTV